MERPEAPSPLRWVAGAAFALAIHAGVAATVAYWPREQDAPSEPPGAIMIDLAVDSMSTALDTGDDPTITQSTAAPSTAETQEETTEPEGAEETPPEETAEVAKAPEEPEIAEPTPEPPEETAPVEEAPLVPEPAVVLPKEVPEKKVETTPIKAAEVAEKPVKKKEQAGKPAPKSESKQKQTAAGGSKGSAKPSALFKGHPAYPAAAKSRGIKSGRVTVRYTISPSGSVSSVSVVSSSPPGVFDSATVSAIRKWRFTATGASSTQTQTVHFKLR